MSKQKRSTTLRILRTARELLIKHGWIQHGLGSEARGFCAMGAIYAACGRTNCGRTNFRPAERALQKAVGDLVIISWNDHPARTKKQVLGAFKRAEKYV